MFAYLRPDISKGITTKKFKKYKNGPNSATYLRPDISKGITTSW